VNGLNTVGAWAISEASRTRVMSAATEGGLRSMSRLSASSKVCVSITGIWTPWALGGFGSMRPFASPSSQGNVPVSIA
jgi:hypothetical protein